MARQECLPLLHSEMSDLLLDYEALVFFAASDDICSG
jgi:hypothetical protein